MGKGVVLDSKATGIDGAILAERNAASVTIFCRFKAPWWDLR